MTDDTTRRPPRKSTRKATASEPVDTRSEAVETRSEPVEGAALSSSKGQDEGALTSSAHIHKESDEKAPIKGAEPEGESEPDAETKPESLTGEAPSVDSGATEAEEDEAQLVTTEPTTEVLQVRRGMFGIKGSGDLAVDVCVIAIHGLGETAPFFLGEVAKDSRLRKAQVVVPDGIQPFVAQRRQSG